MGDGLWSYFIGYAVGIFGSKERLMEFGAAMDEREQRILEKRYAPEFSGRWVSKGTSYQCFIFYLHNRNKRFSYPSLAR